MIEPIMYLGIGFLFAALIGVAVAPLIHDRAVRLTMRRLESSIPQSMAEIQADKDLLRAEFAMSTRRLEIGVEQLREQATSQRAELGRKSDVINRLAIERKAQNVETFALKAKVESLKEQLASVDKEKVFQRHEPDFVSLVPKDWPRAELESASMDSSTARERHYESNAVSLTSQRPTTEEARSIRTTQVPDAGRGQSEQRTATAHEASGISAALRPGSSIHVSTDDQIAHVGPGIGGRSLRSLFVVALMGLGATFAWQSYSDWAPLLSWLSPASTEKSPPAPASAAAVPSAQVTQLEALTRDLADVRSSVEQHTAKQEQDVATLQADQGNKQKLSSTEPQSRANLNPYPETKPTTIPGWALLEVIDGTAVVQGPNGVWRVTRGDTVPGVGRVDSIVRWGNHWIVATSSGLISTP